MLSTTNRMRIQNSSRSNLASVPQMQITQRSPQNIENIECRILFKLVRNVFQNPHFDELVALWHHENIPEIHQKYYYNIILNNQLNSEHLIQKEIDDIKSGDSPATLLHQLTIARERCLKEIAKCKPTSNFMDFVKEMSKFVYDLRKLTLHLFSQYRKWNNKFLLLYKYNYRWIFKQQNYLLKIQEDHQTIQIQHPTITKYLQFSPNQDIFYVSIVNQAINSDTKYCDYLALHKVDQIKLTKIHELQNYANSLLQEQSTLQQINFQSQQTPIMSQYHSPTASIIKQPIPEQQSEQKQQFDDSMPEYESESIYTNNSIEFILKKWAYRDMKVIMKHYESLSQKEYLVSFSYPFEYVQQILGYGCEAFMVQINENGLLLASLDIYSEYRTWIIHMILFKDVSLFFTVIRSFILMLREKGDIFDEVQIYLAVDRSNREFKPFKEQLLQNNFKYLKSCFIKERNVNCNVFSLMNGVKNPNKDMRPYHNPIVFINYRTFSEKYRKKFYSDEELMEAQLCANLGKSTMILFSESITSTSQNLIKQRLYGQQCQSINAFEDIEKHIANFKSPVKSGAVIQQFNIKLNFIAFTSEIHQKTRKPYLRIVAGDQREQGEQLILEVSCKDNDRKMYLIPTIDPSIKIYVFELMENEINNNVSKLVKNLFEKYENKQECKQNIWLPFIDAEGHRSNLNDATISGYFMNQSKFSIKYPRTGLNSFNFIPNQDKVLKSPFLVGIIQSDLEVINRPLFSLLVQEENLINQCQEIPVAQKLDNQAELTVCSINPQDLTKKIAEILKFSCIDTLQSFTQDQILLFNILKFYQEACVLQLFNKHQLTAFCVIYIDSDHRLDRRWVIELVAAKDLNFFDIMLQYTTDLLFSQDQAANEIHISQYHYPHDEQLLVNKNIANGIKKAGFRWRQVDNDSNTKIRKTIYYLKRPQIYKPKIDNQQGINFDSYYSLQVSDLRNKEEQGIEQLEIQKQFQFFEDVFLYKMNVQTDTNPFIKELIKKNDGILPTSSFEIFQEESQLHSKLTNVQQFPIVNQNHDKIYANITNAQLKWKKARPLNLDGTPYLEFPMDPTVFMSVNKEHKLNIYFVQCQNPLFYVFFAEVKQNMVQQIQQNYLEYTTIILQEFNQKKNVGWDVLVPTMYTEATQNKNSNWMHQQFSITYYQTIEQVLKKDKGSRHKVLSFPLFVGLLHEEVLLKYERPLFAYVAID